MHDDPFVVYPYRIAATSPFGRIPDSALPGSEVPMDSTLPHFQVADGGGYLKLELFLNGYLRQVGSGSVCPSSSWQMEHFALVSGTGS